MRDIESSGIDIDRAGIVEGDALHVGKGVILLIVGAAVVEGAIAWSSGRQRHWCR